MNVNKSARSRTPHHTPPSPSSFGENYKLWCSGTSYSPWCRQDRLFSHGRQCNLNLTSLIFNDILWMRTFPFTFKLYISKKISATLPIFCVYSYFYITISSFRHHFEIVLVKLITARCCFSILPENISKILGFLMFSGGIEKQYQTVMGQ